MFLLIFLFVSACHETCQTCKGGNATDCESCRPGYREEHESKEDGVMACVDVNECVEQRDLCPLGQYCVNTEGSYKCEGKYCPRSVCVRDTFSMRLQQAHDVTRYFLTKLYLL